MKIAILTVALLPMLSGLPAIAQPPQGAQAGRGPGRGMQPPVEIDKTPPAEDFKPSALNQAGRQYPKVNSQRRVRTSLRASNAQSVLLDIGGFRHPMTKGADGVWIGISNAQDEGFHYYQLSVDGVSVPDPGTLMFYGEPLGQRGRNSRAGRGLLLGTSTSGKESEATLTVLRHGLSALIYLHHIPGTVRTLDAGINPAGQIG